MIIKLGGEGPNVKLELLFVKFCLVLQHDWIHY